MRKHLLKGTVGAVALAMSLVGGAAVAGGDCPEPEKQQQQQSGLQQEQQQEGVGGSGSEEQGVDASELEAPWEGEAQQKDESIGTGLDASEVGKGEQQQGEATGGSGPAKPEGTGIDATEAGKAFGLEEDAQFRLNAGVGLSSYTGDLNEVTGLGPAWNVTAEARNFEVFGLEFGYSGNRNPITDPRVAEGAAVWKHGVEALAKLGPTLQENIRPFVGAGVGVSYVNANQEAESLYSNDIMTELPLAAGVDLQRGNLNAGVRATYRFLGNEEFAEFAAPGASEGGFLTGQVTLGGQF